MMMHVDQQKASRRYWDVGVSTAAKLKTLLKRNPYECCDNGIKHGEIFHNKSSFMGLLKGSVVVPVWNIEQLQPNGLQPAK